MGNTYGLPSWGALGKCLLCCLIGYLLGNFSLSYLLVRRRGFDVRKDGSGNAGASNAFILAGGAAFFAVAISDVLKAFIACRLCRLLFPDLQIAPQLAGVACIFGHMYPVALGFRGGKGLASLGGVALQWDWRCFLVLFFVAVLIVMLTRYVCFVAPTMSVVFPLCFYLESGLILASLILLLPAAPIFVKHMVNFSRIRQGTEPRISYLWNRDSELKRIGRK